MPMRHLSRLCPRASCSRTLSSIVVPRALSRYIVEYHQHQEAEAEASAWTGAPMSVGEANGLLATLPRCPRKTMPLDLSISPAQCLRAS